MPKVCLSEKQKDHDRLVANLLLIQNSKRKNNAQMGEILGISSSAYSARKKEPEKLTYAEIKKLCGYAKIDVAVFVSEQLKVI